MVPMLASVDEIRICWYGWYPRSTTRMSYVPTHLDGDHARTRGCNPDPRNERVAKI